MQHGLQQNKDCIPELYIRMLQVCMVYVTVSIDGTHLTFSYLSTGMGCEDEGWTREIQFSKSVTYILVIFEFRHTLMSKKKKKQFITLIIRNEPDVITTSTAVADNGRSWIKVMAL